MCRNESKELWAIWNKCTGTLMQCEVELAVTCILLSPSSGTKRNKNVFCYPGWLYLCTAHLYYRWKSCPKFYRKCGRDKRLRNLHLRLEKLPCFEASTNFFRCNTEMNCYMNGAWLTTQGRCWCLGALGLLLNSDTCKMPGYRQTP